MKSPDSSTASFPPGGAAASEAAIHGGLLLVAGDGVLTTFPLLRESLVIGRAADCDIALDHPSLSRRHARLQLGPPILLEDLGSKNGTRVATNLLTAGVATRLSVGESFHVGGLTFVVVRGGRGVDASTRSSMVQALRVTDPTIEGASPIVRDIAQSGLNALILGETGVGKEVLAQTLHHYSARPGRLVAINCAAIAPALIESELFGHEKGAFTGAAQARPGLIEAAARGTVFLDEVGELPAAAQAKLLRALEAREVTRVGGVRSTPLDVRFIAATHRALEQEIAEGRFRSDLFFRLDGVTLVIPPLRERRSQIEALALRFFEEAHQRRGHSGVPRLQPGLIERLASHAWPGNVRELKAVVERAVLLARGGEIGARHVVWTAGRAEAAEPTAPTEPAPVAEAVEATARVEPACARDDAAAPPPWTTQELAERQRIVDALHACSGNQTRAADRLGVSRATLVNRLTFYRIPRPRK